MPFNSNRSDETEGIKVVVFSVDLKAKPGKEQELEEALKSMIPDVQNEDGALVYALHRVKGRPGEFYFYERYKDQAALEFHDSEPYTKRLIANLSELLAEEMKVTHFEEIASIKR
ncbi:antibiotic biosynthesis monooxygenase [Cohnella sp. LGH]|uniref:putative quinol monooxygenase n=1 Tax=Cohnella sp. LGH TaxID=1619153 RepID=UPI001ADCF1C5|nr:putative quinol monooxygenase [Cohnella sp. LGH]QTH44182.1 antibiotic biosynthesis monooxygenase [Cohnella sp. LGH]